MVYRINTISLDTIKQEWKNKLLNLSENELFNIYVHSPFCLPPKCRYCCYKSIHISTLELVSLKDQYYNEILIRNIRDFSDILTIRQPLSIYFGGGTSSLMTIEQMQKIFSEFQKYFDFRNVMEKCFEFNPRDATEEKIKFLMSWNFTRFTFGYQSTDKNVLRFNNRKNIPLEKIKKIFRILEQHNINYNIDFMTFIYRDNLIEDLKILKTDLLKIKELNPRCITVYPHIQKLIQLGMSGRINKIRIMVPAFRKIVNHVFKSSDYTVLDNSDKDLLTTCMMGVIISADDQQKTYYNSTSPRVKLLMNQSVLAFGGILGCKPYSYIPSRIYYNTVNLKNKTIYEKYPDVHKILVHQ